MWRRHVQIGDRHQRKFDIEIFKGLRGEFPCRRRLAAAAKGMDSPQQEQRKQKTSARKQHGKPKTKGKQPKKSAVERMETTQLEEKIEVCERRRDEIDRDLADPETWNNRKKASRLESERKKIQEELEPLEFEWSRRADEK